MYHKTFLTVFYICYSKYFFIHINIVIHVNTYYCVFLQREEKEECAAETRTEEQAPVPARKVTVMYVTGYNRSTPCVLHRMRQRSHHKESCLLEDTGRL